MKHVKGFIAGLIAFVGLIAAFVGLAYLGSLVVKVIPQNIQDTGLFLLGVGGAVYILVLIYFMGMALIEK